MDPVFLALLVKLGVETVIDVIRDWKNAGEPTPEQIREAFIEKTPEELMRGS